MEKQYGWREKTAREYIQNNDSKKAFELLEDDTWTQEILRTQESVEIGMNRIYEYIKGQKLLIEIIKSESGAFHTIEAIYDRLCNLIERLHIRSEMWTLYDYAEFLWRQKNYSKALEISKRFSNYIDIDENRLEKSKALNQLGVIYYLQGKYKKSETMFRDTLKIRYRLASESSSYEPYLATTCVRFALLLSDMNRKKEAVPYFRNSIKIYRKFVQIYPDTFKFDLIESYNDLANLMVETKKNCKEAELLYRKALKTCRSLSVNEKDIKMQFIFSTLCNNLGNLLRDSDRLPEAESLYKEALDIRLKLAEINSDAYEEYVLTTQENLKVLYQKSPNSNDIV